MSLLCVKCGASLVGSGKFCAECGTPAPASDMAPRVADGNSPAPGDAPVLGAAPGLPTHIAALLCYLFTVLGGIVFLNLDPYRKDPLIRFHAWQAILFFICVAVLSIAMQIFIWLLSLRFLLFPVQLLVLVGWVLLMVKAYSGEKFKLPVLGDLAEQQASRA